VLSQCHDRLDLHRASCWEIGSGGGDAVSNSDRQLLWGAIGKRPEQNGIHGNLMTNGAPFVQAFTTAIVNLAHGH
jgi:hypothetical protein